MNTFHKSGYKHILGMLLVLFSILVSGWASAQIPEPRLVSDGMWVYQSVSKQILTRLQQHHLNLDESLTFLENADLEQESLAAEIAAPDTAPPVDETVNMDGIAEAKVVYVKDGAIYFTETPPEEVADEPKNESDLDMTADLGHMYGNVGGSSMPILMHAAAKSAVTNENSIVPYASTLMLLFKSVTTFILMFIVLVLFATHVFSDLKALDQTIKLLFVRNKTNKSDIQMRKAGLQFACLNPGYDAKLELFDLNIQPAPTTADEFYDIRALQRRVKTNIVKYPPAKALCSFSDSSYHVGMLKDDNQNARWILYLSTRRSKVKDRDQVSIVGGN